MTMVINEKGQGRWVGIVRKLKFNMKKLNCRWQGLNICVERGEGKSPTKKSKYEASENSENKSNAGCRLGKFKMFEIFCLL